VFESKPEKLYLVTRDDLSPGLQAAQVAHGAFEYSLSYPEVTERWSKDSNYVVILSVSSLIELELLAARLDGLRHVVHVREPDIDDELTCIVAGPEYVVSQLLANLPLALREEVPA
jgi:peptidyl-tRNA hydrolase